jgi:ABC-2 type transport system ATP-binding protein
MNKSEIEEMAPPTPIPLALREVSKRYGSILALDRVSLALRPGEFFGLLGPNGAGKTTLMSLVAGIRLPDSGEVLLFGERFEHRRLDQRKLLGFVPQSIALYEDLDAVENLRLFGRLYGLDGARLRERVEEGLRAVQLFDRRRSPVKTFSGGMRRRLNIVASILHRPRLLLCDEPTVGVDPQSRNAIFEYLEMLNSEGMTIVYSTHYMEEATRLCSRIGIIDHGKVLALGTLEQLLRALPAGEQIRLTRDEVTAAAIPKLNGFGEWKETGEAFMLSPSPGMRHSEFFAAIERIGLPPRLIEIVRPTLEDLFLHLTGKLLRDS